jgi:hypothetical protein
MNNRILTCNVKKGILKQLEGNTVVLNSGDFSIFDTLRNDPDLTRVRMHCIYVTTSACLSDIMYEESWKAFPIAIESPSIGRVYEFLLKSPVIRKLNIRFYLSTTEPSCYTDARILSSLGFSTAVIIDGEKTDWKALTDLMIYALLNRKDHADILPFNYTCKHFRSHEKTDYNAVYFNDPGKYLHLDGEGGVHLKKEHTVNGSVPVCTIDAPEDIEQTDSYQAEMNKWSEFFISPTKCASCKGWRICLGKFKDHIETNPGCERFFSEFLDTIETERKIHDKRNQPEEVWQPSSSN